MPGTWGESSEGRPVEGRAPGLHRTLLGGKGQLEAGREAADRKWERAFGAEKASAPS